MKNIFYLRNPLIKTPESRIAKFFGLDGDNRLKHANPWSVWTRFGTLPFLVLAIWSRVWIGRYCLIPITLLIIWLILNPTLFKKPKTFDHRGSKAVLGERYRSERFIVPVLDHHNMPILILTILQSIGGLCLIYGLRTLHPWITLLGTIVIYLSKMRFLDRMAWVYGCMKIWRENNI